MARRRAFDEADVIERAMMAFWSEGYGATTPAKLVDATGLSKSSLYSTFGSKQGVFLAALDAYLHRQLAGIRQVLAEGSLMDGLHRMYATLLAQAAAKDAPKGCLICTSTLELPADEGLASARLNDALDAVEGVFFERFARAVDEGELPESADPLALARFVTSSNMGLQVMARRRPDPAALQDVVDGILRAVTQA